MIPGSDIYLSKDYSDDDVSIFFDLNSTIIMKYFILYFTVIQLFSTFYFYGIKKNHKKSCF
jgi:hypothetical protein